MYTASPPDLDDWPAVRYFYERFEDSPYFDRLCLARDVLRGFFIASVGFPENPLGVILLWANAEGSRVPVGLGVLELVSERVDSKIAARALIRGVYIEKEHRKKGTEVLYAEGRRWAAQRGADMLIGYLKYDPAGFADKHMDSLSRHGFNPLFVVVGHHIEPGGN